MNDEIAGGIFVFPFELPRKCDFSFGGVGAATHGREFEAVGFHGGIVEELPDFGFGVLFPVFRNGSSEGCDHFPSAVETSGNRFV